MSEDGGASIETRRATNATRATTTKDETFVLYFRERSKKKKIRGTHSRHLAAKLTPHPQLPSLFGFSAIANELLIISST